MDTEKSNFIKALSKEETISFPLYCTGFPEIEFLERYIKQYDIYPDHNSKLILKEKDYSIIKNMGFNAVSIWDFRKGKGGYSLEGNLRVDGWGRIYKVDWYQWDGVIKNKQILEDWEHLNLPSEEEFSILKRFLINIKGFMDPVLSLPGLFEKTWQSMGYSFFAKSLRNNIDFIENVIIFFADYIKNLIKKLQEVGSIIFLIADDCAYKKRTFLPNELWYKLFYNSYQDIIELIHNKNHKVILHSDGYISTMMDIFVELGFDAVQSLEPNSGVDIYALFKRYNDQICFIGNLDISTLLSYGTPSQVRSYIENLIKKAKKFNSSLIISPTQQIIRVVKPENIKSMIETTINFKYVLGE